MYEKIKPIGDRALLRRMEIEEKTPGGIIIPDAAKEKAQTAKVVAVGQGRTTPEGRVLPLSIKAGDVVFVGKYAGTEAGGEYLIVREDEILGIIEQGK
jgi:chaperonin GroES